MCRVVKTLRVNSKHVSCLFHIQNDLLIACVEREPHSRLDFYQRRRQEKNKHNGTVAFM